MKNHLHALEDVYAKTTSNVAYLAQLCRSCCSQFVEKLEENQGSCSDQGGTVMACVCHDAIEARE